MPLRLDHANLVVRDLDRQVDFYCRLLGFRVVLRRELSGDWISQVVGARTARMDCAILEAPGGGARLELLAYDHPEALELPGHEAPSALGLRHLAFTVDDLDTMAATLIAEGVRPISAPATVPFRVGGRRKRLLYFHDPEGVLLELAEYTDVV
ncbi:MAG: VOC family protein [Armatimonadetes bacterium]|nr:VOC family protein [Armatimonadota bacterium]